MPGGSEKGEFWSRDGGICTPRTEPNFSTASVASTAGPLSLMKEQAPGNFEGGFRDDALWMREIASRDGDTSDNDQKSNYHYKSRISTSDGESDAEYDFQSRAAMRIPAPNAGGLKRSRRARHSGQDGNPMCLEHRSEPGDTVVTEGAQRAQSQERMFSGLQLTVDHQHEYVTDHEASCSQSSEASQVSDTEPEFDDHGNKSKVWRPHSPAPAHFARREALVNNPRGYIRQYPEQHTRQSCHSRSEGVSGSFHCMQLPSSSRITQYSPSCIPSHRVEWTENAHPKITPFYDDSWKTSASNRSAQQATRLLQHSHSREVRVAMEAPRRNWERSLRSFQAALRMHSPTEEDSLAEATDEELEEMPTDGNSCNCPRDGESIEDRHAVEQSEEEAAVGYESDSADEIASLSLSETDSTRPRYKSAKTLRTASRIPPRKDSRRGQDTYNLAFQKQLEMRAQRRLHQRRDLITGFPSYAETFNSGKCSDSGTRESSAERHREKGRRTHQQRYSPTYCSMPTEAQLCVPPQSSRQRAKCIYSTTARSSVAEKACSSATGPRAQRSSTAVNSGLCRRRARREAYLHLSTARTMGGRSGRPAEGGDTPAEGGSERREIEVETLPRFPAGTEEVIKESYTHVSGKGKLVKVCKSTRIEGLPEREASSSTDMLSPNDDSESTEELDMEAHSLLMNQGGQDKSATEESNRLHTSDQAGTASEEITVDHSQRGVPVSMRHSLATESASSHVRKNGSNIDGQRQDEKTAARENTLLLRLQSLRQQRHPVETQERKGSLDGQRVSTQSEEVNASDNATGRLSPRFGTPDGSGDEDVEKHSEDTFPAQLNASVQKQITTEKAYASLTHKSNARTTDNKSIEKRQPHNPEIGEDKRDNITPGQHGTGVDTDFFEAFSTEEALKNTQQGHNTYDKEKYSCSPRSLSHDGVDTASTLTTASPRGEGSLFVSSPLSSFPPPMCAEQESNQHILDDFALPPPVASTTKAGLDLLPLQAAAEEAHGGSRCSVPPVREVLASTASATAASVVLATAAAGAEAATAEQTSTAAPVLPAVLMATTLANVQEPCFVSVEEQQEKLERLRGACVAKFSEMQLFPVHRVLQGGEQSPDSGSSNSTAHICSSTDLDQASGNGMKNRCDSDSNSGGVCESTKRSICLPLPRKNGSKRFMKGTDSSTEDASGTTIHLLSPPNVEKQVNPLQSTIGEAPAAHSPTRKNSLVSRARSAVKDAAATSSAEAAVAADVDKSGLKASTTRNTPPEGENVTSGSLSVLTAAAGNTAENTTESSISAKSEAKNTMHERKSPDPEKQVPVDVTATTEEQWPVGSDGSCSSSSSERKDALSSSVAHSGVSTEEEKRPSAEVRSTVLDETSGVEESTAHAGSARTTENLRMPASNVGRVNSKAVCAVSGAATPRGGIIATRQEITKPPPRGAGATLGAEAAQCRRDSSETQQSQQEQALSQRVKSCSKKRETRGSVSAAVRPVLAIPPSVPTPRTCASAVSSKSSLPPSLVAAAEASQQKQQQQQCQSVKILSAGRNLDRRYPPRVCAADTRRDQGDCILVQEEEKKKPYLPPLGDADSWTSAIAAAVSPSLSLETSYVSPAAAAAAVSSEAAASSLTEAEAAAAATTTSPATGGLFPAHAELPQSLFLRALLTPRAFLNFDSCSTHAQELRVNSSNESQCPAINSCTAAVAEANSDVSESVANVLASPPLLMQSAQMLPHAREEIRGPPENYEKTASSRRQPPKRAPLTARMSNSSKFAAIAGRGQTAKQIPLRRLSDACIIGTGGVAAAAAPLRAAADNRGKAAPPRAAGKAEEKDSSRENAADVVAHGRPGSPRSSMTSSPTVALTSSTERLGQQRQENSRRFVSLIGTEHMRAAELTAEARQMSTKSRAAASSRNISSSKSPQIAAGSVVEAEKTDSTKHSPDRRSDDKSRVEEVVRSRSSPSAAAGESFFDDTQQQKAPTRRKQSAAAVTASCVASSASAASAAAAAATTTAGVASDPHVSSGPAAAAATGCPAAAKTAAADQSPFVVGEAVTGLSASSFDEERMAALTRLTAYLNQSEARRKQMSSSFLSAAAAAVPHHSNEGLMPPPLAAIDAAGGGSAAAAASSLSGVAERVMRQEGLAFLLDCHGKRGRRTPAAAADKGRRSCSSNSTTAAAAAACSSKGSLQSSSSLQSTASSSVHSSPRNARSHRRSSSSSRGSRRRKSSRRRSEGCDISCTHAMQSRELEDKAVSTDLHAPGGSSSGHSTAKKTGSRPQDRQDLQLLQTDRQGHRSMRSLKNKEEDIPESATAAAEASSTKRHRGIRRSQDEEITRRDRCKPQSHEKEEEKSAEEEHMQSCSELLQDEEDRSISPSDDEAAPLHVELLRLQKREQEQQQLPEALLLHVKQLHADLAQLAQKNAAYLLKVAEHEQIEEKQRTALAHAKLKMLALQAQLPSWKGGLFRATAAFPSSTTSAGSSVESKQQEDLQKLEQQVAALRQAVQSKQLLYQARNEKLHAVNEELRQQLVQVQEKLQKFENDSQQTERQIVNGPVFERLSMQVEDMAAEASRKGDKLESSGQENLLLREKLEELLLLLEPLKEALRAARMQAAQQQQTLHATQERLHALKQQQQQMVKKSKEGGVAAAGVQTEDSSFFSCCVCAAGGENSHLTRALARQKMLMRQLRQKQQKQACSWLQQRSELQQRIRSLETRLQQSENLRDISVGGATSPSLSAAAAAATSANIEKKKSRTAGQLVSSQAAGVSAVVSSSCAAAESNSSCAAESFSAEATAAESGRRVISSEKNRKKIAPALTAGGVAADAVGAAWDEEEKEDELMDYVNELLSKETGELSLGGAAAPAAVLAEAEEAGAAAENDIVFQRKRSGSVTSYEYSKKVWEGGNTKNSCTSFNSGEKDLLISLQQCRTTPAAPQHATAKQTQLPQTPGAASAAVPQTQVGEPAATAAAAAAAGAAAPPPCVAFAQEIPPSAAATDAATYRKCGAETTEKLRERDPSAAGLYVLDVAGIVPLPPAASEGRAHAYMARPTCRRDIAGALRVSDRQLTQEDQPELGNLSESSFYVSSPLRKERIRLQKAEQVDCFADLQFERLTGLSSLHLEAGTAQHPLIDNILCRTEPFGSQKSKARRKVQELRRQLREQGILS